MPTGEKPGPGIKHDHLYESLRKDGESQEKSARVAGSTANRSRTQVSSDGLPSPPYGEWTLEELRAEAARVGVENARSLEKSELVELLHHR